MKGPISIPKITGVGTSNAIPLDPQLTPFSVGLQAVATGTVTYNIEYTLDDIRANGYSEATGNWQAVPNFSALTASHGDVLNIPCTAIRLNVTAGTGSVAVQALQAGRV